MTRGQSGPHGRFMSDAKVRNLCIMPALALLIAFNVFPLLASLG
ncbi:MAG: hypothetical protein JWO30_1350, partial [Fibrobacteres bacterium]|nr:hypothetical protein [Fibrobacterota bacterium]